MDPISPELYAVICGAAFIVAVVLSIRVGRLHTRGFVMAFPLLMLGVAVPLYVLVAVSYYLK